MLHLCLCFSVWTIISTILAWRITAIAKIAVNHLQKLHQIPCSRCAYFTGDYRLKCTVNPTQAMSEEAIGCRDFIAEGKHNQQQTRCYGCLAHKPNRAIAKKTKTFNLKH